MAPGNTPILFFNPDLPLLLPSLFILCHSSDLATSSTPFSCTFGQSEAGLQTNKQLDKEPATYAVVD
ncbi:hypothetical protein CRE_00651 [Caenorhabditis remanei]|uniref:Uncharacterized protein n=2 Tax=Caenorhabditis remanei TaxID=31234 RepID=E3LDM1_CAERE|nr:hypothetical protein CRE_00651 [Caenorhabditis remanei]